MIFVTSYNNPDLDGIACAIAYSEFLRKKGKSVQAIYSGDLGLETEFVKRYTQYFPVQKYEGDFDSDAEFVLVDTSDPNEFRNVIIPDKVIEIIDHHPFSYPEKFPHAKKTIEYVGSCATLVTEQLKNEHFLPSPQALIYLYSAIISNTVNFKNPITTPRDREAAQYLQSQVHIPKEYVYQMFYAKSEITKENLFHVVAQDFFVKSLYGIRVGIGQIEIMHLRETIDQLWDELVIALTTLQHTHALHYVMLVGIDIESGYTVCITIDEKSRTFFSRVLEIPNLTSRSMINVIMMRKQIWPKVDKILKEEK